MPPTKVPDVVRPWTRPTCAWIAAWLIGLATWLMVGRAAAHAVGLSQGYYRAADGRVFVELTFAANDLDAFARLDADRDGRVTPSELSEARARWTSLVERGLTVSSRGTPCPRAQLDARLVEPDGLVLSATFGCPRDHGGARVVLSMLDELAFGHRHAARTQRGDVTENSLLFRPDRNAIELTWARDVDAGARRAASFSAMLAEGGGFVRMGLEHILTGYDHLGFLLALVVVERRLGAVLAMVTAFTVAHSITLALSVLGVVSLPAAWVEPAIALSIVYVGIENLVRRQVVHRWRLTFAFGLVHGFGFAGALASVHLPAGRAPLALLSFNVGVEIGQLMVLAAALPLCARLRASAHFGPRVMAGSSLAVALLGAWWFAERIG